VSRVRALRGFPALLLAGCAAALLLPGVARSAAGPWQSNEQSRVRLVSPWAQAPREGELSLGLEVELIPGWHIYWKNSGDAGYPPSLSFSPTPEISGATLLFPAPERYELRGGLVAFGYEDHVVYPVSTRIEAPEGDRLTLTAELDYLVCEVDCLPYSYTLTLEQPLAAAGAPPVPGEEAELLEHWWARLPRPVDEVPGLTGRSSLDLTDPAAPRLTVEIRGAGARANGPRPEIFFEPQGIFDLGRPELDVGEDRLHFTVGLALREVGRELPPRVELAWTVTGLAAVDPEAGDVWAVEARRTLATGARAASTPAAPADGAPERRARAGLGSTFLRAFGGGLLLGLTPAALVVLLAQLLALGGLARHRAAAPRTVPTSPTQTSPVAWSPAPANTGARRLAATAAGIGIGFWGLAAAGLAASTGPVPVTWGVQLQHPRLLAALAVGMLGLALNLFDLFDLPLRRGREPGDPAGGGLLAGLAVAVLSLGSNGPFLAQAAGPALAAGPLTAFAAATLAGLGLALPYVLLAAVPGLRRAAAGAGQRLERVPHITELLGFGVLAGLLWLLYLLAHRLTPESLALLELLLLLLALLAWVRRRARRGVLTWVLALLMLLVAVLAVRGVEQSPPDRRAGLRVGDFRPGQAQDRGSGRGSECASARRDCRDCLV
jgi:suppressor for copper-sensitivity B